MCEFVDREKDIKIILDRITESSESSAIILVSNSGVGKSSLSKKLSCKIDKSFSKLFIKTKPTNTNISIQEGEYIKLIFNKFYKYYNDNNRKKDKNRKKLFFKYFYKRVCDKTLKKNVLEQLLNELSSKISSKIGRIFFIISIILKKIFKLDYFNLEKYVDFSLGELNKIQEEYIKYLLKECNNYIVIDNIQNIDYLSLNFIEQWFCDTYSSKNIFVFEYTLSDDQNYEEAIKLRDLLNLTGVKSYLYRLDNMDINHVIEIISNRYNYNENNYNNIKLHYEHYAKGNIRKSEDFVLNNCENNENDSTINILNKLCRESKYIITLVYLHQGTIFYDYLVNMFSEKSNEFIISFEECIQELINKYHLLEIVNSTIVISHASIYDAISVFLNNEQLCQLIAYRDMENFYKKLISVKKNINDLQILLNLYLMFEPINILFYKDELKYLIYNKISRDKVSEYVLKILNAISNKIRQFSSILYEMIDWCLDLELFGEAKKIINSLKYECSMEFKYKFFYCKINFVLRNYDTVINYINHEINVTTKLSEILIYNMFLIVCYRSINNYEKINEIIENINKNKAYNQYLSYGIFLRLAEVYMDKESCASKIEESLVFFKEKSIPIQMAKSHIALSYIYSINGKLNSAQNSLIEARKILGSFENYSSLINVNLSAISILNNDIDNSTWHLLDSSEKILKSDFSRLAIINNKIICCMEGINKHQTYFLEKKAKNLLSKINDKHMHAIVSYNLYLLFKQIDETKANEYKKIAEVNHFHCKSLSIRLGKSEDSEKYKFLLSRPWHVCFLSFWDFDLLEY